MNCDDRQEQILLYLTDGLDQAERDGLEEHLQAGCPRCLAELSAARETIGWLPLALSPRTPPDSIRHALMSRLSNEGAASAGSADPTDSADTVEENPAPSLPFASGAMEPKPEKRELSPRSRRRRQQFIFQLFSPVAAAVLAIIVTYAIMTVELRDGHQRFGQLAGEVAELKDNLAKSDYQLSELTSMQETTREIFSMFESQDAMYVQLEGSNNEQSSLARMLLDLNSGLCYFFPGRNTHLDRDSRYTLWFFADDNGEPIQAAEFSFDERGPTRFELQMPDEPQQYTRVSVRQLPDGDEHDDEPPLTEVLFGTFGSRLW